MRQSNSFSEAELQAALERLLSSETLRSAPGLRNLLAYLGEKALHGEAEALKEYTVGLEAFSKPADYSPQLDASVRVQAGHLRQKLDEYYRTEGIADPVRIDFPKGHFVLHFVANPEAGPKPAAATRINHFLLISVGLLGLFALYLGLELHQQREQSPAANLWSPGLDALWHPLLNDSRRIVIAFNTPLFFRISHFYIRDTWENSWESLSRSRFLNFLEQHLDDPSAEPSQAHVGVGEVNGVFLLSRLLAPRSRDLVVRRSLSLAWEDLAHSNVIFLGDPKFNPKLKALPLEHHFLIEKDAIRNLRPAPGEQTEYRKIKGPDTTRSVEGYAVMSRLSLRSRTRGQFLVLSSNSTQGTWAAAQLVTDPALADRLVERLQDASGRLPPSFQVLVRARFQSGVPTDVSYVTHRVLSETDESFDPGGDS